MGERGKKERQSAPFPSPQTKEIKLLACALAVKSSKWQIVETRKRKKTKKLPEVVSSDTFFFSLLEDGWLSTDQNSDYGRAFDDKRIKHQLHSHCFKAGLWDG